jgi:hypothetical protein
VKDATERASRAWRKATRPTPIPRNLSTQYPFPASHRISFTSFYHTRTDICILSKLHSSFSIKRWCNANYRHNSCRVQVVCFVVRARRVMAPSLSEPLVLLIAALRRLGACRKSTLSSDHLGAFRSSVLSYASQHRVIICFPPKRERRTKLVTFVFQLPTVGHSANLPKLYSRLHLHHY